MERPIIKDGDMGIEVSHHFCGAGYAKVYQSPAGLRVFQHRHKQAHEAHLILGSVDVTVDNVTTHYTAPAVLTIAPHIAHEIVGVTPFLWACVWPDVGGLTDPDLIDHEVIE